MGWWAGCWGDSRLRLVAWERAPASCTCANVQCSAVELPPSTGPRPAHCAREEGAASVEVSSARAKPSLASAASTSAEATYDDATPTRWHATHPLLAWLSSGSLLS